MESIGEYDYALYWYPKYWQKPSLRFPRTFIVRRQLQKNSSVQMSAALMDSRFRVLCPIQSVGLAPEQFCRQILYLQLALPSQNETFAFGTSFTYKRVKCSVAQPGTAQPVISDTGQIQLVSALAITC